MILDIDIGNTRLKWAVVDCEGRKLARGAKVCKEWNGSFIDIDQAVSRIRVSSVKGDENPKLSRICQQKWGISPEFASVVDGVHGLSCGYRDCGQLGVDRWLAVLACWKNICRQAVVVDAGSALTIDVLAAGRHRGGYIIPGFSMMGQILGAGTWGVKTHMPENVSATPGKNTSSAVNNGSLLALAGAVIQAAETADVDTVVLTGGDGPLLEKTLAAKYNVILEPDLVIDGLAVALP